MWEYKAIKLDVDVSFFGVKRFDVSAMEREFNSLGESDWELISLTDMPKTGYRLKYFMAIFKRKKIDK